jgi:hypothetical protein
VTKTLSFFILCCCGASLFARGAGPAQTSKPLVVIIDHKTSGFVYLVNSVAVTKGLLYTLTFLEGPHSESVLLVHEDAPIAMLTDARGIMNKAGYVDPKIFYFSRHKDWMAEVTLSKVLPFSADAQVTKDNH